MNKNRLVLVFVLLLLIGGVLYFNFNRKEKNIGVENNEVLNKKEVTSTTENVIKTYRSEKLGVEFDYALSSPEIVDNIPGYNTENKVIEKDNTIMTNPGGGIIKVFKKDPNVTFENTLKILMPDCKIKISGDSKYIYNKNMPIEANVYFKDSRTSNKEKILPKEDFAVGQNGDVVQTKENLKCMEEVKKINPEFVDSIYITSGDISDKFIGIHHGQSVEAVLGLYDGKITTWMSTVRFIK